MARRFSSIVDIPGLGDITSVFKSSVKGTDVLVGAIASLAGIYAVKYVQNKFLVGKLPEIVLRFTPAISGALTGTALYMLQKKKNRGRATGHAIGAVSAGLAINAINELKAKFPELADVVDLRLAGVIVDDATPRLGGFGIPVDDPTRQLGDLAALDMGLGGFGETDEIEELASL